MISASEILEAGILIVDDQEIDVQRLTRVLTVAGYKSVASATDPYQVCELHRLNRYAVILLNLQMPGLDGFGVMEGLKEIEPEGNLPVLAITAQPSHKLRALQAGAKDFITKPFDQAEILIRIRNMLEIRLLQNEARNYSEFLEQMLDERTIDLRDREALFRQAFEACPNGMVMVGEDGKIITVNTETERLFGYSRQELFGQSVEILMASGLRGQHARHRAAFAVRPETRHAANRELSGCRKDGVDFPVEIGLYPIHTSEGMLVLSVFVDISERKRISRLKDEFVAMVSHELRTPLTSIAGSLGLLVGGGGGKLPKAVERLLNIAQANSQRLVWLLNDILDIEKIESGQLAFDLEDIPVRALIEQAIESIHGFAESYGVHIRLEAGSASATVHADTNRLLQVVTNLLSNAIKFSPRGGEVTVAIENNSADVHITVRDRGPGIPEAFKSRVFEKFAQADTSDARKKGGTGLGLSIVKEIVTRLNGEVTFDDAPGGGTIFRVTLPACQHETAPRAGHDGQADRAPIPLHQSHAPATPSRQNAQDAKAAP